MRALALTRGSLARLGRGVRHHERASREDARHPVEPSVDEEREAACRNRVPRGLCPASGALLKRVGHSLREAPFAASIFDRQGGEWGREEFPR